jgi:putative SOS response-associated peptidase YedK
LKDTGLIQEKNMCGRFTLTLEISALQMAFDLGEQTVVWNPSYNIAPTTKIPLVTNQNPNTIALFQWGLVPAWAKDSSKSSGLINARSETAHEKPSFRRLFQSKRCLIFADGFYEWQKGNSANGKNTPYYFRRKDQQPFVFAGLWDSWPGDSQNAPINSCTILTCTPNRVVSPIHDRMPVILDWHQGRDWLDAAHSAVDLQGMLLPAADDLLLGYKVTTKVNSPANNTVECIQPVEKQLGF